MQVRKEQKTLVQIGVLFALLLFLAGAVLEAVDPQSTQDVLNLVFDSAAQALRVTAPATTPKIFNGTASDVSTSIPGATNFTSDVVKLIAYNDDNADAISLKLNGTGASTSDANCTNGTGCSTVLIKAGDPPLYLETISTTRISVITPVGTTAPYRIIVFLK